MAKLKDANKKTTSTAKKSTSSTAKKTTSSTAKKSTNSNTAARTARTATASIPVQKPAEKETQKSEEKVQKPAQKATQKSVSKPKSTSETPAKSSDNIVRIIAKKGLPDPKRAVVSLVWISPWSVFKMSFFFFLVLGFAVVLGASALLVSFDLSSIFAEISELSNVVGADDAKSSNIFNMKTVVPILCLLATVCSVLFSVIATIMAIVYNLLSKIIGGIHITIGED
jgi:hypothetical protein